ncbi:MAG: hypothetical protein KC912_03680 [Proteobacteria bacterium]|nr:hypothetical protein [Pseudomonadota bacterium]
MIDPSLLASPPGTSPLEAPSPKTLVRETWRRQGEIIAADGELPPKRYPNAAVRGALQTPPPVRFRSVTPTVETPVAQPLSTLNGPPVAVTAHSVRQAFTFGKTEPDFDVKGVGNYSWAPRRPDQDLLYGDLDGTLRPAMAREASPPGQLAAIIWVAVAIGVAGGISLAAWFGA